MSDDTTFPWPECGKETEAAFDEWYEKKQPVWAKDKGDYREVFRAGWDAAILRVK